MEVSQVTSNDVEDTHDTTDDNSKMNTMENLLKELKCQILEQGKEIQELKNPKLIHDELLDIQKLQTTTTVSPTEGGIEEKTKDHVQQDKISQKAYSSYKAVKKVLSNVNHKSRRDKAPWPLSKLNNDNDNESSKDKINEMESLLTKLQKKMDDCEQKIYDQEQKIYDQEAKFLDLETNRSNIQDLNSESSNLNRLVESSIVEPEVEIEVLKDRNTSSTNTSFQPYNPLKRLLSVLSEQSNGDTYKMMMTSNHSYSWFLGILTFIIQVLLASMILYVLFKRDDDDISTRKTSIVNIPILKADWHLLTGQFISIFLVVFIQSDVLMVIPILASVRRKSHDYHLIIDSEDQSLRTYFWRILFPNLLQLLEGLLVLVVSFFLIVQSDDTVDLLKDFTALLILSETDNIIYSVVSYGYWGEVFMGEASNVERLSLRESRLGDNTSHQNRGARSISYLMVSLLSVLLCVMIGGWMGIIVLQSNGYFFERQYPHCEAPFDQELKDTFGNGSCNGAASNTFECGFEGGDCEQIDVLLRFQFPNCNVTNIIAVGNGICDGEDYNNQECKWDGGDCIPSDYPNCKGVIPNKVNDGICDGGVYLTEECGWDGFDCCNITNPGWIGNGICDGDYNSLECGWDGGDCIPSDYPNCKGVITSRFGDGICDGGDYNTEDCGWDGGDCTACNNNVDHPEFIGDGFCVDGNYYPGYNTEECGWDGGDCDLYNSYPNCNVDKPWWIGDGFCLHNYNTEDCGYDGGDCDWYNSNYPNCSVEWPMWIGDGICHGGAYNIGECGYDGGDCDLYNSYPDCNVDSPGYYIGNGVCNGSFNTEECGFDGGDCEACNDKVNNPEWIGNGVCDGGDYNTLDCGWDGGDCIASNYPNCNANNPELIGDGFCLPEHNTLNCGWDGGDCVLYNSLTNCNVEWPELIGNGVCNDYLTYNTEECGFDGGDCVPTEEPV